jgi:imidazole glycerol-phosphate synthase subunit HisH
VSVTSARDGHGNGERNREGRKAPTIALVDYGIGNLPSASKALERAGAVVHVTRDPAVIATTDGVVLPGVGAMGRCMEALDRYKLRSPVLDAIASGRPFLGICVGMQMLHTGSDEFGGVEGLDVFDGRVRLLPDDVKRPQMQWNLVRRVRPSKLLGTSDVPVWAYFVHSFAPECHEDVVGVCEYGGDIPCVVERGNVMGTQFHPEKSGTSGIALLSTFVALSAARVRA